MAKKVRVKQKLKNNLLKEVNKLSEADRLLNKRYESINKKP